MEEVSDTWAMSFGDGSEGSESALLSLSLPQNRMLVARVHGEPSPLVSSRARTSYLCVNSEDEVVVRTSDGAVVWCERHGSVIHPVLDRDAEALPNDWGGETQAMVDGFHLIEWLAAESYEAEDCHVHGTRSNYGPFTARLHPDYRFVTSVVVGEPGRERNLLETIAYRLVLPDEAKLGPNDVDPGRLEAILGLS